MEIKRGTIWYIESSYNTVGSEQRSGRPAIIVSNDKNNQRSGTVQVVYLTTQPKHDLPTHVTIRGTGRVSTALCEQITAVAVERIGTYCGEVTDEEMAAVETAMLVSLGIGLGAAPEPKQECGKTEETPPAPDSRLAEAQAECRVLREMYNALLERLVKAS